MDAVLSGLREAASSRAAALGEARRELATKEAALRDRDARVNSLEERQKQLVELCERQVADARAARDEEVAAARQAATAAQGDAARDKADVIAGAPEGAAVQCICLGMLLRLLLRLLMLCCGDERPILTADSCPCAPRHLQATSAR